MVAPPMTLFLERLTELHRTVPALLPFALAVYGGPSAYLWTDQEGRQHTILQGEGVEQGDPLAPAFYALA